ncbi:MAG: universal stress protein [Planctomycetes bacterium]|nr:universal stress protein [Planctomycetota bacterium]
MTRIPSYASVVVLTDLSERAARALPHACALVATGGTVHLVHVLEVPDVPNPGYAHYGPTPGTPAEKSRRRREAESELAQALRVFGAPEGLKIATHVYECGPTELVERLLEVARELRADLICIASHGRRGLARVLLGSVAEGVLRRCDVPTLVVRVPESERQAD